MRIIDAESLDFKWLDNLIKLGERVEQYISETPAVRDVKPIVHGEWKWDREDIYTCSVCRFQTHVDEDMNRPQYNYCPYCGAEMDNEKYGGVHNEMDIQNS